MCRAFGNVSLLHITDVARAAPADAFPRASNSAARLIVESICCATRHARQPHALHPSRLRDAGAALRQARRLRAPRDAGEAAARARGRDALLLDGGDSWQGSATALWTRGADMIGAQKRLGVDCMTGALGVHLRRRARAAGASPRAAPIEFLAQNVRTADFEEPVFKPYALRALQRRAGGDHRPGVSRTRRSPIRATSWPTGLSASRKPRCRSWSTRRAPRARGRWCCSRTTAWTSTSSSPRGCAASTRSSAATRTTRCRAPVVVGKTLVTNAGSNGKFLGVLDLQVERRRRHRLPLPPAAGVLESAAARPGHGRLHRRGARAVMAQASQKPWPSPKACSIAAATYNGSFDELILDALLAREGRARSPFRPASAGAPRSCPAKRSRSST